MKNNNPPKLIVAEDETDLRESLSEELTNSGYIVFQATNGQECLALQEKHNADLILLDIIMPKLDGIEVIRALYDENGLSDKPKIIVLTNQSDMKSLSEIMNLGVFTYVIKSDHSLDYIRELVRKELS